MMIDSKTNIKKAFMASFPHTIPVLTGFMVLGIAYGVLMQTKGYGIGWSVLFSAAAFCGSMQFVAITLLTTAFNPLQAFFLSIMVNARHLFYGISMLEKYKGLGKIKIFLIYTLCDETFSISCSIKPPDEISRKYFYFFVSLLNYLYWVSGTFIGGILGSIITFNTKGLDFVLTSLFVVLLIEQMKKKENRWPAIIGIVCTTAGLFIFGRDNPVIPSMIIILAVLAGGQKKLCR
ncbi:MAG: AzlC family ABC transporter permease [Eubacteriales bacterium]